jgi:hypothetical protein
MERYAWYLPTADVEAFEAERLSMGNVSPSAWVIFALNKWIGRPDGLREKNLGPPSQTLELEAFYPNPDAPAEPYWGVFEVDKDGRATGAMWRLSRDWNLPYVLLSSAEEAEEYRKLCWVQPFRKSREGNEGVRWAVRGITKEALRQLEQSPDVHLCLGVMKNGWLVWYPMPSP